MLNSTKVRDPPLKTQRLKAVSAVAFAQGQEQDLPVKHHHLTEYTILVCELESLENQCMLEVHLSYLCSKV